MLVCAYGMDEEALLPDDAAEALELPFVTPTGYGLGKWGWVTATLEEGQDIPLALFQEWIVESYRKQAPKRLLKELAARTA